MHSMDRALEVFRTSWRRAAQAQLAVGVIGLLCSLAFFSSVLTIFFASMVLGMTKDATRFPHLLASFVSASKWRTKGVVVASGRLATLSVLSLFLYCAMAVDLGHILTWFVMGGIGFLGDALIDNDWSEVKNSLDLGVAGSTTCSCSTISTFNPILTPVLTYSSCLESSSPSPTCRNSQWFFVLLFYSATGLVVLFINLSISISARGYITDAKEWLVALPRPKLPPPIMWDTIEHSPTAFLASSSATDTAPAPAPAFMTGSLQLRAQAT